MVGKQMLLANIDNSRYIEYKRLSEIREKGKRIKMKTPQRNPQPTIQMNINDALSTIEDIPIQKINLSKIKLEFIDPDKYNAASTLLNFKKK